MPFYRCTITTALTPGATAERLRGLIRPKPTLRERFEAALGCPPGPPFSGTLSEGAFKAMRIIHYRNSFRPVIRGTYALSETGGTRIHLRMTMHPAIVGFMLFVGVLAASMLMPEIARTSLRSAGVGIAVAGLVTAAGFFPEATMAKRIIERGVQP
jgi:hypothetical protein